MSTTRYPVVMLVDDNELDNFINKKLLENEKFADSVLVHQSAQSALDELKKLGNSGDAPSTNAQGNALPRIIFLDIMMPHMDGFGFLEELGKLDENIKSSVKVIMLSTSESFKDLNRANQSRYVYKFLNKPLSKGVLDAIQL
jgi:CheY-like chemotaxis protein